jgi:lipopolysaccharide transport system ATP-binding protein
MHAVEVSHLTKEYRLGAMQSLRQTAANVGARLSGRKVPPTPLFKALDDVSFIIEPGEVVGVIGHNGAGKSTLLKMLSRISTPTSGSVKVNGRVAPLIEVGAGFVGEFTGRENVYLNGAILGLRKKEIDRKFDEIVDFAEMADFIDTPVKRYSSGMQVKLAFAVATCIESEILIVDEVLAVGDLAFQRKCLDRMQEIIKSDGRTVLVVSHNIRQIERFCSRVLLMDGGRLLQDGAPHDVCNVFYERSNAIIKKQILQTAPARLQSDEVSVHQVRFTGRGAEADSVVRFGQRAVLEFSFTLAQAVANAHVGVVLHSTDLVFLTSHTNYGREVDLAAGSHVVKVDIPQMLLLPGVYQVRIWIGNDIGRESFCANGAFTFHVVTDDSLVAQQGAVAIFEMPSRLEVNGQVVSEMELAVEGAAS